MNIRDAKSVYKDLVNRNFNDKFNLQLITALVGMFGHCLKHIQFYSDLPAEVQKIIPNEVFDYLTRPEGAFEDDLRLVSNILKESEEYGLTTEVILQSFYAIKDNPSISVAEALTHGCSEWLK